MRIGLRRSAILAAFALAACGQRGPLYLPKVPPLPPPPGMAAPADTGADVAVPASTARGTRRAASAGAASGASASNATPSDAAQ
ncbi:MAG: LPS translocon maturation chaperone LptM [Janthinobacterium lividum]